MIPKTLVSPLHHIQNLDQTVFMTKLQKCKCWCPSLNCKSWQDFGESMLPFDRPPQPVALRVLEPHPTSLTHSSSSMASPCPSVPSYCRRMALTCPTIQTSTPAHATSPRSSLRRLSLTNQATDLAPSLLASSEHALKSRFLSNYWCASVRPPLA
jgi:hypothetical protein